MADSSKPTPPADDDFLRSFGGLLDDPFAEPADEEAAEEAAGAETPAEEGAAAESAADGSTADDDTFALPEIPGRPILPRPRVAPAADPVLETPPAAVVDDDTFALPAVPGAAASAPGSPTELAADVAEAASVESPADVEAPAVAESAESATPAEEDVLAATELAADLAESTESAESVADAEPAADALEDASSEGADDTGSTEDPFAWLDLEPPAAQVASDEKASAEGAAGAEEAYETEPSPAPMASEPALSTDPGLTAEERAAMDLEFERSQRAHRAAEGELEDAEADDAAAEDPFALPVVPTAAPASAADDLIAATESLAPPMIEAPVAPAESLAERMGADMSLADHEDMAMDLSLPSFEHPDETTETKAVAAEEGPLVIRRRIVEQSASIAPAAARFPIIAGIREAAHRIWNGPLGWQSRPGDVGYVTAKVFLRLGLGLVAPVLLAFFLFGLPYLGAAYPAHDVSANTELAWSGGLVKLPEPLTLVDLPEGGRLPSTTEPILTNLYGAFFVEYDAAVVSGDTAKLETLLTPDFATTVKAEIADLRAKGYSRVIFGFGGGSDDLFLRAGSPGSDPTDVLATVGDLTNVIIVDAAGNEISNVFYGSFDAHFARLHDGTWRLSSLVFNPVEPEPTPEPEDPGAFDTPAP